MSKVLMNFTLREETAKSLRDLKDRDSINMSDFVDKAITEKIAEKRREKHD